MNRRAFLLGLAVLSPGTALAQVVHVVDPAGGGDFTTIAPAYGTAAAGDVLLVEGGTYPGVTLNRGVAIAADAGSVVTWSSMVRVVGLPAGEALVLSGMVFREGLEVKNCAGSVRVQSSRVARLDDTGRRAVLVDDSADVIFSHCLFRGSDGVASSQGDGEEGGSALSVWGTARVGLYDTTLEAGDGGDGDVGGLFVSSLGGKGGAGAYVGGTAQLYAMGCTFKAGDGGDGFEGGDAGDGGDGVRLSSSSGAVRLTNVNLFAGVAGVGPGAHDGQEFVGPVEFLNTQRREIFGPAVVRENEQPLWTIVGRPGDVVYLPASLVPKYRFLYAAVGVQAFEFPLFHNLVPVGLIGGASTLQLVMPPDALPMGAEARVLFHQVFVISSAGQRVLGLVHTEVVLDDTL